MRLCCLSLQVWPDRVVAGRHRSARAYQGAPLREGANAHWRDDVEELSYHGVTRLTSGLLILLYVPSFMAIVLF